MYCVDDAISFLEFDRLTDKADKFITSKGFVPTIPRSSYLACMVLSYEGDLENENLTDFDLPFETWLQNYANDLGSFDYE